MTRLLAIFFLALTASAGTVTLVWDANDASDGVTKYRVYCQQGTNAWTQLGYTVTTNFTATGLLNGVLLTFQVTAVSTNNIEGPPSNSVSTNLPLPVVTPKAPRNPRITDAIP